MNKTTLMEVGYSRSKALVKATAVAALLLANPVAAMASDGAAGKLNVQSVQQGSLEELQTNGNLKQNPGY